MLIDEKVVAELVKHARPFGTIFHRAFDPIAASNRCDHYMAVLAHMGIKGVLTSGGPGDAIDNRAQLRHMAGNLPEHFELTVGGGIRGHNVARLARDLSGFKGRVWLHSAAKASGPGYSEAELEMIDSNTFLSIKSNLTPAKQD
jgi:copper homeostasis protein